jgi:hypothetical protein
MIPSGEIDSALWIGGLQPHKRPYAAKLVSFAYMLFIKA